MKKLILMAMVCVASVLAVSLVAADEVKKETKAPADVVTVKGSVVIVEGAVTIKTADAVVKVALTDEGKKLLSMNGKIVEAVGKMVKDELNVQACKEVPAEVKK